jgi:hypothetical protein
LDDIVVVGDKDEADVVTIAKTNNNNVNNDDIK